MVLENDLLLFFSINAYICLAKIWKGSFFVVHVHTSVLDEAQERELCG